MTYETKFKVGDKVRVVKVYKDSGKGYFKKGWTGVIDKIDFWFEADMQLYLVWFEKIQDHWYAREEELELIEEK